MDKIGHWRAWARIPLVMVLASIGGRAYAVGEATWLAESSFTVSSAETGMVGYLEAWGGSDFGYSYSYALANAPTGLSVDPDSGMLSLATPVAAGTYSLTATVKNRKDTTKVANFPVTLKVLTAITTGTPTATQILHRDYVVDSWTSPGPTGTDYTAVLMAIRDRIVADQAAAGEEKLRARIVFGAGKTYTYTNNRWTFGIQYLDIVTDNPGTRAKLQNVAAYSAGDAAAEMYPLQIGRQYSQCVTTTSYWICENNKRQSYKINASAVGATGVILQNPADAANIKVGRYVVVASYDQQTGPGGNPPNMRYVDHAKVTAISGTSITLDRKLHYAHRTDYWEDSLTYDTNDPNSYPGDNSSIGNARIFPIDRDDVRLAQRARVSDIEFLLNPNNPFGSGGNYLWASGILINFQNCIIQFFVPTGVRFARVSGGSVGDGEIDKLINVLVFDGATSMNISSATGVDYLLVKNSTMLTIAGLVPKQLRVLSSILVGTSNPSWGFPAEYYMALKIFSPSATQQVELRSIEIRNGPDDPSTPVSPYGDAMFTWVRPTDRAVMIGTDGVTWNSGTGRLTVPTPASTAPYQGWKAWNSSIWEGAIVVVPDTSFTRWGVITKISGLPDQYIYNDIDWKAGAPPASGELLQVPSVHELLATGVTLDPGMIFDDMGAPHQETPGISRSFPLGYPASTYGF